MQGGNYNLCMIISDKEINNDMPTKLKANVASTSVASATLFTYIIIYSAGLFTVYIQLGIAVHQ